MVLAERPATQPRQVRGSGDRYSHVQLQAATSTVSSVSVAGADLTVSDEMKVLGVVLDRRLSFDSHVIYTVDSGSLAVFKSRPKTFLFRRTFNPV